MAKVDLKVLNDPKVEATLTRLHAEANAQSGQLFRHYLPKIPAALLGKGVKWDNSTNDFYTDKYISLEPDQGKLLYLLARSIGAKTIVEFGTSFRISTIYLATAIRDNGGGLVIGTELVPEKAQQARRNLAEAGLSEYVEIREGDALQTLKELDTSVDLLLVDGFPTVALSVLKLVAPRLRLGGMVLSDNIGTFKEDLRPYVEYLQNPTNGFRSATLGLRGGTEVSVKVS
jgi:predicted O-methyltransferase YrrM